MADMGGGLPVPAKPSFDAGDTAWMLTASTLVLLMTLPGCVWVLYCAVAAASRVAGGAQRLHALHRSITAAGS